MSVAEVHHALRMVLPAGLIFMAVLIFRLGFHRWRDMRAGQVDKRSHPLVYASYGLALLALAVERLRPLLVLHLAADAIAVACVVTGFLGVTRRVRLGIRRRR